MKITSLILAITIAYGLTTIPTRALADDNSPPLASITHDTSLQSESKPLLLIKSTA